MSKRTSNTEMPKIMYWKLIFYLLSSIFLSHLYHYYLYYYKLGPLGFLIICHPSKCYLKTGLVALAVGWCLIFSTLPWPLKISLLCTSLSDTNLLVMTLNLYWLNFCQILAHTSMCDRIYLFFLRLIRYESPSLALQALAVFSL